MPTFFQQDALSELQQANWDVAMRVYSEIVPPPGAPGSSDGLAASFGASHQPGHPKSALFARLLSGKAPLVHPPPRAFSYPWYALIEESGPHNVLEVWAERPFSGGALHAGAPVLQAWRQALVLEQAAWWVVSCNAPARELLRLARSKSATSAAGLDALRADPRFIVRCGAWPEFELALQRTTPRVVRLDYARSVLRGEPRRRAVREFNPLDARDTALDARIEHEEAPGDVDALIEAARESLARWPALAERAWDGHGTEGGYREFLQANPDVRTWATWSQLEWHLSHHGEWPPLADRLIPTPDLVAAPA